MHFSSIKSSLELTQSALPVLSAFSVLVAILYTVGYYTPIDYEYFSLHPITDYITMAMKTLPFAVATALAGGILSHRHNSQKRDAPITIEQNLERIIRKHKWYWNFKTKSLLASIFLLLIGYKVDTPFSAGIYGISFNIIFTLAFFSYMVRIDPVGIFKPEWNLLHQACGTALLAFFIGYANGQSQIENTKTTTINVREEESSKGNLIIANSSGFILFDRVNSNLIYIERQSGMTITTSFKPESTHRKIENYLVEKCSALGSLTGPCTVLVSTISH